jgi:hypothetical protein
LINPAGFWQADCIERGFDHRIITWQL